MGYYQGPCAISGNIVFSVYLVSLLQLFILERGSTGASRRRFRGFLMAGLDGFLEGLSSSLDAGYRVMVLRPVRTTPFIIVLP